MSEVAPGAIGSLLHCGVVQPQDACTFSNNIGETVVYSNLINDKIYNSKEIWFSEMAKLSKQQADESMKIVRCEYEDC